MIHVVFFEIRTGFASLLFCQIAECIVLLFLHIDSNTLQGYFPENVFCFLIQMRF